MIAVRRVHVTLFELLIVMVIIGLVASVIGIGIHKALVDQRFRSEVSKVVDELRLAQDLMLILGTDVRVVFVENQRRDGIDFWIETETQVQKALQKEISRRHDKLKTIRGAFFEDELLKEATIGKIEVKFLSNGSVMSKGILVLSTSNQESATKGVLKSYICLAGIPKPISSYEDLEPAEMACHLFDDEQFDSRLTRDTFSKLPEKAKQAEEQAKEKEQSDNKDNKKNSKRQKAPQKQPKESI